MRGMQWGAMRGGCRRHGRGQRGERSAQAVTRRGAVETAETEIPPRPTDAPSVGPRWTPGPARMDAEPFAVAMSSPDLDRRCPEHGALKATGREPDVLSLGGGSYLQGESHGASRAADLRAVFA